MTKIDLEMQDKYKPQQIVLEFLDKYKAYQKSLRISGQIKSTDFENAGELERSPLQAKQMTQTAASVIIPRQAGLHDNG